MKESKIGWTDYSARMHTSSAIQKQDDSYSGPGVPLLIDGREIKEWPK